MQSRGRLAHLLASCAFLAVSSAASAAPTETVEVTATRVPEPVNMVPADVTVISGDELRARGAMDLRSALALVAGTEAPSGGDTGPAGAVPSFWGLHEFDAFLLVVDGVPWGGAFNPSIPTLDLNDVERIEVMKGAAPVMFGATSFVGIIQVIHYPAGHATNRITVGVGDRGSARGSMSLALPDIGSYRQSLAVDGESLGYADKRETVSNGHVLYRGSLPVMGGDFGIDGDLTFQRQVPPSPVILEGTALTTRTPRDANYNPADARIDENRYHADLHYTRSTSAGDWDTTLSFAHSDIVDIRGFLRPTLLDDGSSPNADSQAQRRLIQDGYFDTHLSTEASRGLSFVWGLDVLYGFGKQASVNGEYYAPLNGQGLAPRTTALHVDEINTVSDTRSFVGQYVQADWKPTPRLDVLAGLRLNETLENKTSAHLDGFDPTADTLDHNKKNVVRPAGTLGFSYRTWSDGADEAVLYADYRNAFKPAAIDFGPDNTPGVLNPETAQSYEAGLKGKLFGGRFDYQTEAFLLNFKNLVVATTDALGNPVLQNAGGERLQGIELETRTQLCNSLLLAANVSYHDAKFTHFTVDDNGTPVDVSGRQLTLSPHVLASAGLIYTLAAGLDGSLTANYVGSRFLNEENTATASAYATLDAHVGYGFDTWRLFLDVQNLTDQRPPVTQSEFGAGSYYLLDGRRLFLSLTKAL
ncbi:MAG: TonB-dependent receptor [Alphaproteobacteria bacterium]|nr:TonB-dependent receptor [Alphaproteobacteria bacterium]